MCGCCAGLDGGCRLNGLGLCVSASEAGHECGFCSAGLDHVAASATSERHFEVLGRLMCFSWMSVVRLMNLKLLLVGFVFVFLFDARL
jgi:hypothetical protein